MAVKFVVVDRFLISLTVPLLGAKGGGEGQADNPKGLYSITSFSLDTPKFCKI